MSSSPSQSDSGTPAVSVVVPTFNRGPSVRRLLEAFERQDLERDRFEVLVVVDGSRDGTSEQVRGGKWGVEVRVLEQENRGRAAACNAGVRAAKGTIVVLLDDDMEPVPAFVRAHMEAHRGVSGLVGIGPVPIRCAEDAPALLRYRARVFAAKLRRFLEPGHTPVITDAYTGNASILREDFLAVGGFNEGFTRYGHEDYELLGRLLARGGRLGLVPEAVAVQHYDKTFRQLARNVEDEGATAQSLVACDPAAWSDVQLSRWGERSRRHRKAIEWLLRIDLRTGWSTRAIEGATRMLEVGAPSFLDRWYDLSLDYFYWLGVVRAPGPVGSAFRKTRCLAAALDQLHPHADSEGG